jgi:CHAT domain-containing protein/Tfp pilus assembly protein PilF
MMSIKLSSGPARAWWIVAAAAALAPPHARPQEPSAAILEPGVPIDRELSGAQAHVYRLALAKDQYAAAIVEQRGIDVVVQLMDPAGKQIAEFDAESRRQGQEFVSLVAGSAGNYELRVRARYEREPAGRYEVRVQEIRAATEKDRALDEARMLLADSVRSRQGRKFAAALESGRRALEIRGKLLGPQDPAVADCISNVSEIYRAQNDFGQAEPLQLHALEIRKNALGSEHPAVATSLTFLAELHRQQGDFAQAEDMFRKALDLREKAFGPDHPLVATSLNNLGAAYFSLGALTKAAPLYRRALEIREKSLPPGHTEIADSLNNTALIYRYLGNLDQAGQMLQRAVSIWENAPDADQSRVAVGLFNLGMFYRGQGNQDQAEAVTRRSLTIMEKTLGSEHPSVGRVLTQLAQIVQSRGQLAQAEELQQRALKITEKALGPRNSQTAESYNSLAEIRRLEGDLDGAREFFRRALDIWQQAAAGDPRAGSALDGLAQIARQKGEYAEAIAYLKQALAISEKGGGLRHSEVSLTLVSLSRLYTAQGDYASAIAAQSHANEIIEHNMVFSLAAGSERQKLAFLSHLSEITDRVVTLAVRLDRDNPDAAALAAASVLQRKGRVLDAMADNLHTLRQRLAPADQELLSRYREVSSHLAGLVLTTPQPGQPMQAKALDEQREQLEAEIARRTAGHFEELKPVTLEDVQAAIPEDAALVEFILFRPFDPKAVAEKPAVSDARYALYVVRRQGPVQWKDLGAANEIDGRMRTLRQALREPHSKGLQPVARQLDELLLRPARALAGTATHLLISPDGDLNLIPFEALIDEQGRYAVERYSLSYLTSGRDLLRARVAPSSSNQPAIVADPLFGEPLTPTAARAEASGSRSVTSAAELSKVYFAPLAGTAEEARSIHSVFSDAAVLSGKQASKSSLQRLTSPKFLHIATHGFFLESPLAMETEGAASQTTPSYLETHNPLLRSGLALAGANLSKAGGREGILTAMEASSLNLWGTRLVTLSACETGIGEVRNGEGVYGLRRAFLLAGAETVVMSLWPVSDRATLEIMTAYYAGLKQGLERGEALRRAQLHMLKRADRRHPFFWAGFIQVGDWRSLDWK